jgi:hypothetical protein
MAQGVGDDADKASDESWVQEEAVVQVSPSNLAGNGVPI